MYNTENKHKSNPMTQVSALQIVWVVSLLFCTMDESASSEEDITSLRPNGYKKWRTDPNVGIAINTKRSDD